MSPKHLDRRQFLKSSAGLAAVAPLASPSALARTAWAGGTDSIRVGLIGCGGRGTGACMEALRADPGTVLVAMGDAFQDRLDSSLAGIQQNFPPEKVQVSEEHRFVGFDAFQKVIDSGVDVVLLATPPGFRPMHIRAALEAGKHVFAEKPVAVDSKGIRSVLKSAKLAREKGLALASGFCWRANNAERAIYGRIAEGGIGEVRTAYATYLTGTLWHHARQEDWSEMQYQMRNWYYYTYLSGDHIVEQAVHSIDKISWAFQDVPPLRATALGSRQVRTDPKFGHIYDNFSVVYDFPNGGMGVLLSRQQKRCYSDNSDRVLGTKGIATIQGWTPKHVIEGEQPWAYDGPRNRMYQTEHDELFASIRAGQPINHGAWMAQSTLLAIMGRMAAYTGQAVTWEQALNSKEDLLPQEWHWGDAESPKVAVPGRTKLV